jgi:hypothetical protein
MANTLAYFVRTWATKLQPKKSYNIVPSGQYYKTFLDVIYTIRGPFPYDFDWGYTDSDVIMTEKKFYNIGHWSYHCK